MAEAPMTMGPIIPILRSFDEAKAREFYCDYLGFEVDFEHRFAADLPLYMQVSRDGAALHLSEHHGDATPGSAVRIHVDNVTALHRELTAKTYRFARPSLETQSWGFRELAVTDPFGNRLVFAEPRGDETKTDTDTGSAAKA